MTWAWRVAVVVALFVIASRVYHAGRQVENAVFQASFRAYPADPESWRRD